MFAMSNVQQKKSKKKGKRGQERNDGFTVVTKNKNKIVSTTINDKASYNDVDDISLDEFDKAASDKLHDENYGGSDILTVGLNSCSNNNNVGLEVNFTTNRFEYLTDLTDGSKKQKTKQSTNMAAEKITKKEQPKKDMKFSDIVKQPSVVEVIPQMKITSEPGGATKNVVDIVKDRLFNRKNKVLIVMRGLPGSGKTTLARKLVFTGQILAAEDYKKNFDKHYSTMKDCYGWLKEKVEELMNKGVNPIVIDNVHSKAITVVPYIELAQVYRYYAMVEEPDTTWKFNARECANKNTHNVSLDKIKEIMSKYDRVVTVDGVLKMIHKYHLKNGTVPLKVMRLTNRANSISSTDNEDDAVIESKPVPVEVKPTVTHKTQMQVNVSDAVKPSVKSGSASSSQASTPKKTSIFSSSHVKVPPEPSTAVPKSLKIDAWEKLKRAQDLSTNSGMVLPTLPKDRASSVDAIESELIGMNGVESDHVIGQLGARNVSCGSPYGSIGDMTETRAKLQQQGQDGLFNAGASYELDHIDLDEEFLAFEANLDQKNNESLQNITESLDNGDSSAITRVSWGSNLKRVLDQQDREFMPNVFSAEVLQAPAPYNTMGLVPPVPGFDNTNPFMFDLLSRQSNSLFTQPPLDPAFPQFPPAPPGMGMVTRGINLPHSVPPIPMNEHEFVINDPLNNYPTFTDGTVLSGLATVLNQTDRYRRFEMVNASTSTTPNDFNILHCIREGIPYERTDVINYAITKTSGRFKPAKTIPATDERTNRKQRDKSCQTLDDTSVRTRNIDFLSMSFPYVNRSNLGNIYDSCNGDVHETVDVLLDWDYGDNPTVSTKQQLLVTQLSTESASDVPLTRDDPAWRVKSLFDICAESVIRHGMMTDAELQQQVITSSAQRLNLWALDTHVAAGIGLPLTVPAIDALESLFGLLPRSRGCGSVQVVLPIDVARCVYDCLLNSFSRKPRSPTITENDALIASQLQQDEWHHDSQSQSVTSLREIMDEETAQQISLDQYWKNQNLIDGGLKKSHVNKLLSLFPGVNDSWLSSMLDKYNYNIDATIKYVCTNLNMPDPRTASYRPNSYTHVNSLQPPMMNGTSELDGLTSSRFQVSRHPDYEDLRKEAMLHHQLRGDCFHKSQQAFGRGWKEVASYYSQEGHKHTKKMREANLRAADATFGYRNMGREAIEMDLHGLHADEVTHILDRELEKRRTEGHMKVKLITGRGSHSDGGRSRVTPAVTTYLRTHKYTYSMPHDGAVEVNLMT